MSDIIEIPLRKSSNATVLDERKNLLQQKALEDISNIIDTNLNKLNSNNFNGNDRSHETITLLGERGTGKTSFLLNFQKLYHRNEEVIFLDTIDPTLFEDRQNIMITIISMIFEKVKEKELHDNEEWLKRLVKLSEGLNLLDGVGIDPHKKDIWDDTRIILEKGLANANAGLYLEKNFNIFIEYSLSILKKKIFIITFDDIDTNIKKGWPVLEVIRKYLTSSHLQIIISGDWNLYSKIVRVHQWEQIKDNPEKDITKDKIIIDKLEEQYLTKILKPENRIVLKNLNSILTNGFNIVISDCKTEHKEVPLKDIYKTIFTEILYINSNVTIQVFISLLLSLPVRTNIQILIAYYDYLYEQSIKGKEIDLKSKKIFLEKLSNIFITKIGRFNFKDVDFDLLNSTESLSFLVNKYHELDTKKKYNLTKFFNFNPTFISEDMNIFMLVLNAHVVNIINKKPYKIFEWFFRIEYFIKFNNIKDLDSIDIRNYLSYGVSTPVTDQATKIIGLAHNLDYINGFAKIYLYNRWNKNKLLKAIDKFEEDINLNEEYHIDTKKTYEFLINISMREVRDKKESETKVYGSLINILSFIAEYLKETPSVNDIVNKHQIIAYSKNNNDSTIYHENINTDYSELKIIKEFNKWINLSSKLRPISIEIVNSFWEEYFITEQTIPHCKNYKEYLEHQIIRLLNSLLKEMEKKNENSTSLFSSIKKNVNRFVKRNLEKSSYSSFFTKLQTIDLLDDDIKSIDLFEFLLLCPLWKYYIGFPSVINIEGDGLYAEEISEKNDYSSLFSSLALHSDKNDIEEELPVETNLKIINKELDIKKEKEHSEEEIIIQLINNNFDKLNNENVDKIIWDIMRKSYPKYKGRRKAPTRDKKIKDVFNQITQQKSK